MVQKLSAYAASQGSSVSSTSPPEATDLESASEWNAYWAQSLTGPANYFTTTLPDWLVGQDRYYAVGEIDDLHDLPLSASYDVSKAEIQAVIDANPITTGLPEFAQDSSQELDRLLNLLDEFRNFGRLPALDPVDPALDTIEAITFDSFGEAAPSFVQPTKPTAVTAAAPTPAPAVSQPTLPDAPAVDDLPDVPTFDSLNIPTMPTIALPTYSSTTPVNQLSPPTDVFSYVDTGYTSTLKDPLVAKLLDNLVNGGYGIETNDEIQLWNRGRDRETQASLTRIAEVTRQNAALSFPMPQGSLYASLAAAQQEMQSKLASLNREIALKRADLYVENRKFTIEQVQQYEKIAIDLYSSIQERALNMSKATVELAIASYDASVRNFNTQLDAYKAGAAVFEYMIKAELAKVELYKAQITGEGLRLDVHKSQIDIYTAQIQAIKNKVEVYRAQIEGAQAFTAGQEQKIRVFEAELRAYIGQVQAKQEEWGAYTAQLQGSEIEQKAFKARLDAHVVRQDQKLKEKEFDITVNEQKLKEFNMRIELYKVRLETALKQVTTVLENNKNEAAAYAIKQRAYEVLLGAKQKMAELARDTDKLILDNYVEVNNVHTKQLAFQLDKLHKQISLIERVDERGMEYYRSLIGTTLSNVLSTAVKSE